MRAGSALDAELRCTLEMTRVMLQVSSTRQPASDFAAGLLVQARRQAPQRRETESGRDSFIDWEATLAWAAIRWITRMG